MSDDTPTERFRPDRGDDDTPTELSPTTSGDAPTRRLPQQPEADATPTQRLGEQPIAPHVPVYDGRGYVDRSFDDRAADAPANLPPLTPSPAGPTRTDGRGAPDRGGSNGPRIALIVIAVLLVAGLAVLALVFASGRGDGEAVPETSVSPSASTEPTPSETPTPTPTPTPSPTPEETTEAPVETAEFTSFTPRDGATVDCSEGVEFFPLRFQWASTGAVAAWIGVGTTDARANPTDEVDTSGVYEGVSFDCAQSSQVYTVTLEDAAGEIVSRTVTLNAAS